MSEANQGFFYFFNYHSGFVKIDSKTGITQK